jgi:hypothetical protein
LGRRPELNLKGSLSSPTSIPRKGTSYVVKAEILFLLAAGSSGIV